VYEKIILDKLEQEETIETTTTDRGYVTTVKDTGVDIFTDKTFYEIGGDVSLGIRIDPERFTEIQSVGVTIWDIHYDRRALHFDVSPQETYYYNYTLDESFSGEVKVEAHTGDRNIRDWWDEHYFYVGVKNISNDDLVHPRLGLGDVIQETNPEDYVYLNSKGEVGPEYSPEEIQAREEIENTCLSIREPEVPTRYQGDIGLNDPVFMEALREAQDEYNEKASLCFRDYQMQIDQRVAELQEPEKVNPIDSTLSSDELEIITETDEFPYEGEDVSSNDKIIWVFVIISFIIMGFVIFKKKVQHQKVD